MNILPEHFALHRLSGSIKSVVLFFCFFAAGCSFLPKDDTENISGIIPAQSSWSGTDKMTGFWWQAFNDPQLTLLIEQGLSNNFSLHAAIARLEQAAAQHNIQSATLYPQADASAQTQLRDEGQTGSTQAHSLALNLRWEFDLWGRFRHRADAGMYDYLAQSEVTQFVAVSLAGNIARTWYRLTEVVLRQQILQQQLNTINQLLAIAQSRYQIGEESISYIWRQEQLQKSTTASFNQANIEQQILSQQLNLLLGQNSDYIVPLHNLQLPPLPALPTTGVPAELIRDLPNVRELWYRYQARRHNVAEAKAARIPSFTITAGADSRSGDMEELFELWVADLALTLNVPLFTGGKLRREHLLAESAQTRAFYDYTGAVFEALQDVEVSYLHEISQQQQLDSLQEQLLLAQSILAVDVARYQSGVDSYKDILDAQEHMYRYQLRTLEARSQLLDKRIDLYQSLGGRPLSLADVTQAE